MNWCEGTWRHGAVCNSPTHRHPDNHSNGKTDINANGELSTDYVGENYSYATNTHAGREAIRQAHENYIRGLLYFLATSTNVPANVRTEMQTWQLARDEFQDTGGWPHQLYVREARRMVSDYVMWQQNCAGSRAAPDPICLASYGMDCHPVERIASGGLCPDRRRAGRECSLPVWGQFSLNSAGQQPMPKPLLHIRSVGKSRCLRFDPNGTCIHDEQPKCGDGRRDCNR